MESASESRPARPESSGRADRGTLMTVEYHGVSAAGIVASVMNPELCIHPISSDCDALLIVLLQGYMAFRMNASSKCTAL
eukprot:7386508-Prymnesium_polylepis.1